MTKLNELDETKRAETLNRRIKRLKKMDKYIRNHVVDEDLIIDIWLVYMPDEASDDDYEFIANDDKSYYEMLEVFAIVLVASDK